jgi:hypothetical protein
MRGGLGRWRGARATALPRTRKRGISEEAEEVAKVVGAVERKPLDVVAQHQTRRHQQLRKVVHLDALFLVAEKVEPAAPQELNALGREQVLL